MLVSGDLVCVEGHSTLHYQCLKEGVMLAQYLLVLIKYKRQLGEEVNTDHVGLTRIQLQQLYIVVLEVH